MLSIRLRFLTHVYSSLILAGLLIFPASSPGQYSPEASTVLPPIRVESASLIEQDIGQAPASISIVTSEEIERRTARDVSDVLRYAEGVMLTSSNDRGISLRGFDSSYTLILVNGRRLSSRSLSVRHNADADLSWISPSDIERIEVIRGPMSTLYGAEAIGGVVNIITKKISPFWKGSISQSSTIPEEKREGIQNQTQATFNGPLIQDQLGLKITGRSSNRPMPNFPADDSRQYAGKRDSSYEGELNWKIDPVQDVTMILGKNFETSETLFRGQSSISKITRDHFDISHNASLESVHTLLRFTGDYYKNELASGDAQLATEVAQGQVRAPLGVSQFIVAGIETEQNRLENTAQIRTGKTRSDQFAVFLEDSISLSEKSTLTLGVRQTQHRRFGSHLSPRSYLTHQFNENFILKAGVGTGYKPPSLLEMEPEFYLPSCRGACMMIGNENLKPERSLSSEVGIHFRNSRGGANMTVFKSELNDMIGTYFETIGSDRFRLLKNIDRAQTQGLELGASHQATDFLSLKGNFTFTETKNVTDGGQLTDIPDLVSNLTAEWDFSEKLTSFATLSYQGQRKINDLGSIRTVSGYLVADLGGTYRLPRSLLRNSTLSLTIENVGNHLLSNDYGFGLPGRRYFAKLNIGLSE